MTPRKKKGLGLIITGTASIVAGGVLMAFAVTPEWLTVGLSVVAAVCNVMGLYFVMPDTKPEA